MNCSKELFREIEKLEKYQEYDFGAVDALSNAANTIGKAWSGSWLGYHSRVYYIDFQPPPPGATFSQEWGFTESYRFETNGEWEEYDFDDVIKIIHEKAGNPISETILKDAQEASEAFENIKSSALSLMYANYSTEKDKHLEKLVNAIESKNISTKNDFIKAMRPTGQFISRDMRAIEKGITVPPHLACMATALALKYPFLQCIELKKELIKLASYIQILEKKAVKEERIGTNVFIGHGRSPYWRELKDFIDDRLRLPWDEFNRIPVAGITNITRLAQMLDQASIAFLVMTAEDELADGNMHARMNVVHEVGLFQGRLGFDRAIVLLEDGCQEFSNIQGLGQIRFPKGNISAIFEDIRQVLEREKIIE
ncbi:MAG: TIR domain-containing protein [Campylobacterales bacterium]